MPAPWQQPKPWQKPAPKASEVRAAMLAFTPDAEAQARVEATTERWRRSMVPKRTASTGRHSNAARGLAAEGIDRGKGVSAILRAEGYDVTRSHMSQGAFDVVATKRADCPNPRAPLVRQVQAKTLSTFRPSGLNEAVRRIRAGHLPARGIRREAWLRIGRGEWTRVNADTLAARGPYAEEVVSSLQRMLARASRPPNAEFQQMQNERTIQRWRNS